MSENNEAVNPLLASPYMQRVREIQTKVALGFYASSAEDTGAVHINRSGWVLDLDQCTVTAPDDDWFLNKRNQIITYGIKGKKYACLDGSTVLGDGNCLADPSPEGLTGLWSDSVCGNDGVFLSPPQITILYYTARKLSEVMLSGCPAHGQYPQEYDIILHLDGDNAVSEVVAANEKPSEGSQLLEAVINQVDNLATFSVSGANAVSQLVRFYQMMDGVKTAVNVAFKKMTLKIKKWSHGGRVAKIYYFSREKNMLLDARDIQSVEVLEEKTTTSTALAYGLSSNSCNVSLLDRGGRFTQNPDLLKRNRCIVPSVSIKTDGGEQPYISLGRFYSDSWEMDASSSFIRCKAYDELYALQSVMVNFPYKKDLPLSFSIEKNKTAFDLFKEVFEQINRNKHEQEMYGADIVFKIDSCLQYLKVPYLILGERTAWETLQDIAAFALCNIYCTRSGEVHVKSDVLYTPSNTQTADQSPDTNPDFYLPQDNTLTDAAILPCNSFTHQLPIQSRTMVNRVIMTYQTLADGKEEDNTLTLKSENVEDLGDRYKAVFELKNFYINAEVDSIINFESDKIYEEIKTIIQSCEMFYDKIVIEFSKTVSLKKELQLVLSAAKGNYKKIESKKQVFEPEDKSSIKANGVSEYTHPESKLLLELSEAKKKSYLILDKYNKGIVYTQVDWIGTPYATLGAQVYCRPHRETEENKYQILANEFSLSGGLRCKTKLQLLEE